MTDVASITLWHRRARPKPTDRDFQVQLGCHLEEVAEMLDAMEGDDAETRNTMRVARMYVNQLADKLKSGDGSVHVPKHLRKDFLDSLCDQIVTAIGTAYCEHMDIDRGMAIVSTSNWSKFDEQGQPLRDNNGKITKGPNYTPPHLDDCV